MSLPAAGICASSNLHALTGAALVAEAGEARVTGDASGRRTQEDDEEGEESLSSRSLVDRLVMSLPAWVAGICII